MKHMIFAAAVLAMASSAVLAHAEGDATKGAVVFNKCKVCHNVAKGAGKKVGPNLFGIVGKGVAEEAGFTYTKAYTDQKGKMKWTEAVLDKYLTDPKAMMPGTKMIFGGLKDAADRANLIAYLKAQK